MPTENFTEAFASCVGCTALRAVASSARTPQFNSSHGQLLLTDNFTY